VRDDAADDLDLLLGASALSRLNATGSITTTFAAPAFSVAGH